MPIQQGVFALRIGWPIILFTALPALAVDLGILEKQLLSSIDQATMMIWNFENFAQVAGGTLMILLYLFLLAVVAVYWHRNVLLQETNAPLIPLRFDLTQWRYIGYALQVFLIVSAIWIAVGLIQMLFVFAGSWEGAAIAGFIFFVALFPLAFLFFVVVFRFSLVLPAAAIGHRGFGLRQAWEASRGNNWAILGMHLLVALTVFMVTFPVLVLIVAFDGSTFLAQKVPGVPHSLFAVGRGVIDLFVTLVGIGLLSLSYAYLIYDPPKEDARMET